MQETGPQESTCGMPTAITTHLSLLLRIRDSSDAEAWSTFVRIYGPIVHRFGRSKGLQDADAADLVQDVLREVARSIGRFDYDPDVGKFRSWLFTVAQFTLNRMRKAQSRQVAGTGDSDALRRLHNQQDANAQPDAFWESEYQKSLFAWAAEQVRPKVEARTWQAFWKTAVEGQSPDDVAEELAMNVGSVYVAKNRILSRMRDLVRRVDAV